MERKDRLKWYLGLPLLAVLGASLGGYGGYWLADGRAKAQESAAAVARFREMEPALRDVATWFIQARQAEQQARAQQNPSSEKK